ncbi:MAG TPA: urease accessory protein UreD [Steroidobacteraceae bacterium]|jgi:urease accessory protein
MSSLPAARGWQARLSLGFEAGPARTRLAHREHSGPLLVQRPFHPEPAAEGRYCEPCHAYLIHPPGGVASGDELTLEATVGARAHALLTTPAAAKFYRRAAAGRARVRQQLEVAGGALEWLPQENIFYPDADVELATVARLSGQACLIGWEIGCLGLPERGEAIGSGTLRLSLEIWRDAQPLLLERLNLDAAVLAARWGLGGHVAFGTALAYPAGERELELARAALAGRTDGGGCGDAGDDCAERLLACTLIDGVLVCRATARRTDRLRQRFVEWWQALRPQILARQAVAPRIWAT